MLRPLKRSGDRRYYRPEDVELIERIDLLVNREGYTLKGAKAALKGGSVEAASAPAPQTASAIPSIGNDDILPRLRAIRDELKRALAA
jgi:DNA-binding transcriptional MerR regulator